MSPPLDLRVQPPRLVRALLAWALPDGIISEDILGSLSDEMQVRAHTRGRRRAQLWYWRHGMSVAMWALFRRSRTSSEGGGGMRFFGLRHIGTDLRFGLRSMKRHPGPYLMAILTIALGIGAATVMFSVVNRVVVDPLPYAQADRIVRVWPEKRWSAEMVRDVRERTSSFEVMGGSMGSSLILLGAGEPEVLDVPAVSAGFLEVLEARPALGRLILPGDELGDDGAVVVLSHGLWTERFGADPDIVGRTVDLSGLGIPQRTVVGVVDQDFATEFGDGDAWIPLPTAEDVPGYIGSYGGRVVARLAPGVTQEQAIGEMRTLIPELEDVHATQFREARHSPVDVVPLKASIVGDAGSALLTLLAAVGFVLLIACVNVANLLLARADARRREIGLRVALGAGRGSLLRQLMTESVLLGVMGGAVGVLVSFAVLGPLSDALSPLLPRSGGIAVDTRVLLFALGASVLSGLIFGIAPALRAARHAPSRVLEGGMRAGSGRRGGRVSGGLVAVELALSLVLIFGAALTLRNLQAVASLDPGLDPEGVLTFQVVVPAGEFDEPEAERLMFASLLERVSAVPGVERAAFVNSIPLSGSYSGIPYGVEGEQSPEGQSVVGGYRVVSPDYFDVLGIPLMDGRSIEVTDDRTSENVILVNEAFAREHEAGGPVIGRLLLAGGTDEPIARIVGVVGDTRFAGLREDPIPAMYFPADQSSWSVSRLLVRSEGGDVMALARPVTEAIREIGPNFPVRAVQSLEQVVYETGRSARFFSRLLGTFALLALVLGMVGVYGVTSYAISQRTPEIGLRMALGASRRAVFGDALWRGMRPVLLGLVFGIGGAFALSRVMASAFAEMTARPDATLFAAVSGLLAVAAIAAIVVPARRALRVDPMKALRAE